MAALIDILAGKPVDAHRPWPRVIVTADTWRDVASAIAAGRATLLGLWGDAGASFAVHMAMSGKAANDIAVATLECPDGTFPSVGALHPPAIRLERAIQSLYGLRPDRRAGCAAMARSRLLGRATSARQPPASAGREPYLCLSADGRREPASDSGRPGACRHHRAGTLPLHCLRRDGGAARTTSRLRAQGHRVADGGREHRTRGQARRAHFRRQHRRLRHRLRPRRRGGVRCRSAAAGALPARADGGAGAAGQSFRRYRRHLQRRLVFADARPLRRPARAGVARRGKLFRPSADDGPDRSRRRCGRSRTDGRRRLQRFARTTSGGGFRA